MQTETSLRLVLFDATDVGRGSGLWVSGPRRRGEGARGAAGEPADPNGTAGASFGLSPVWRAGAALHRATGAADASLAATSWADGLAWAAHTARESGRKIASLQAWGHGGWGFMGLGETRLDEDALRPGSPLDATLTALRGELAGPEAVVWLRCCSAFGHTGRDFARALADRLGCRVAGHTHIIGFYQSGTHSLRPGEAPGWDPHEGVRFSGGSPAGATWSSRTAPNTVTCLARDLPRGF
ncbi:hypothetical protein SOCE26_077300 [Sorangium cellulosum]|uniref:DUF4347 domain-containing protein n=1 Tax=Sorangium cellulosum TaxID=56 RepID=A0A2L0F3S7_SORCE|nr:DUF4347 domain-containing protein [Sorangium cellulosum]AUX46225.1 hypothetical protein SOCE26_077300 [Sorangium cellulosum]